MSCFSSSGDHCVLDRGAVEGVSLSKVRVGVLGTRVHLEKCREGVFGPL